MVVALHMYGNVNTKTLKWELLYSMSGLGEVDRSVFSVENCLYEVSNFVIINLVDNEMSSS